MNASEARLIIRSGSSTQEEYHLAADRITIGREAFNEIVLHDPEVSRRHVQIEFQSGRYVIEDLGSTNGTFVNGRRINLPTPLNNGDVIEMGESMQIIFQNPISAADKTVVQGKAVQDQTVAESEGYPGWQEGIPTPQPPPLPTDWQTAPPEGIPLSNQAYTGPKESLPPPPKPAKSNRRRFLLGCGCLFLLLIAACAAGLFLLDALAPDFLYCGVGQPLIELLGFSCQ